MGGDAEFLYVKSDGVQQERKRKDETKTLKEAEEKQGDDESQRNSECCLACVPRTHDGPSLQQVRYV